MKKTLIALAVLATSGASFAQVTITGAVAYGYEQSTKSDALASGFGVDTAEVLFNAKEDLGGGMSADAKITLGGVTRAGVSGGDTVLGLNTSMGRLQMATNNVPDYLSGGVSGVAGIGFDERVFGARAVRDNIGFTLPLTSTLSLSLVHHEGAGKLGLGAGAAGAASTVDQRVNLLGATYTGAALTVNAEYLNFDNRTDNSSASAKDALRAGVSYDMGVAKLGLGFSQSTFMNSSTAKEYLVGASVPFGALTFGVQWGQSKTDGSHASGDGTKSGTGLSASYALSKRTSIASTYRSWDSAYVAPTKTNNDFNLLLSHSF